MQTPQTNGNGDWQIVPTRTAKAKGQGQAEGARGGSAQRGRGGRGGASARGNGRGSVTSGPNSRTPVQQGNPALVPGGNAAFQQPQLRPPVSSAPTPPSSSGMSPRKNPPPATQNAMRYMRLPSPTYSATSDSAASESSTLSQAPSLIPDTSATVPSSVLATPSPDRLPAKTTEEILHLVTTILAKLPATADHGLLAYSSSTAPMTASQIAHRVKQNHQKLKSYEHSAYLTRFRQMVTELIVHVGFRQTLSLEPEMRSVAEVARAEFVGHIQADAALLGEFVRFVMTPPTPTLAPIAAPAMPPSTTTTVVDGRALLCLLGGGASKSVAKLTMKILNDNTHCLSIRQVSVLARKIKEQGLLRGFGISIDPKPQNPATPGPAGEDPTAQVESLLSIAASESLLTTLNIVLCVTDITRLTPAELARFTIPASTAPTSTTRLSNETTLDFTEYLRHLRGTAAYHADPYIQQVETWAQSMHQMRMQRWADKEWTTGIFSKWRIDLEKSQEELKTTNAEGKAERETAIAELKKTIKESKEEREKEQAQMKKEREAEKEERRKEKEERRKEKEERRKEKKTWKAEMDLWMKNLKEGPGQVQQPAAQV